jgi:uncharacterized protein (DUF58 family)
VYAEFDELVRLRAHASGFSFLPRQPVHSILAGRYASRLRGRGLNFEELRAYLPGDDTRNIDWKVTARSSEPYVRVYTEEKDRPVWLLIDQRVSMFFASRGRMKSVVAAEAAAVAAWRALAQGDRCGAIVFGDDDLAVITPRRSEETVSRVLHAVVRRNQALNASLDRSPTAGRLDEALERCAALAPHDCLVCVISDGYGVSDRTQRHVTTIGRHNDVLMAFIYDQMEAELPKSGALSFVDPAGAFRFDSNRRRFREAFASDFTARLSNLEALSRKHAIPLLPLDTEHPVPDQLRALLGRR